MEPNTYGGWIKPIYKPLRDIHSLAARCLAIGCNKRWYLREYREEGEPNNRCDHHPKAPFRYELDNCAWPGGYTVVYYMKFDPSDCSYDDTLVLCEKCAVKYGVRDPLKTFFPTTYDEGPPLECEGEDCETVMESSYGDPEVNEANDKTEKEARQAKEEAEEAAEDGA